MDDANYILKVENLCQHFSTGRGRSKHVVKAVNGISFGIRPGETFGLVGESGCGKTTTGRTIIRLYEPTSGKVTFNGRDISGEMNRDLRNYITDNIAMIFQDPIESLNPRMTIEEIVGEGLKVRGITDKKKVRQMVIDSLLKVGLTEEHATRYPHEFSGGQRQRIGVARATIIQPKMIIADEPVSALDVSIQAQVINLLNDLKEDLGVSILFIAHDLSVVKYFSDVIGVMYYGNLVEVAKGDDLYRNPIHPYTKALLSAIPHPNPLTERTRKRFDYNPEKDHNYSVEKPKMVEIEPDHFVYLSESEVARYHESAK